MSEPKPGWLRHGAPDHLFARAMSVCQHPGGFCSQDGYCHNDNKCFVGFGEDEKRTPLVRLRAKTRRLESKVADLEARLARLEDA